MARAHACARLPRRPDEFEFQQCQLYYYNIWNVRCRTAGGYNKRGVICWFIPLLKFQPRHRFLQSTYFASPLYFAFGEYPNFTPRISTLRWNVGRSGNSRPRPRLTLRPAVTSHRYLISAAARLPFEERGRHLQSPLHYTHQVLQV